MSGLSPGQREQRMQRPWGCSVPGMFQDWGACLCGCRAVVRE